VLGPGAHLPGNVTALPVVSATRCQRDKEGSDALSARKVPVRVTRKNHYALDGSPVQIQNAPIGNPSRLTLKVLHWFRPARLTGAYCYFIKRCWNLVKKRRRGNLIKGLGFHEFTRPGARTWESI